jgi:hypothetical protein
MRKTLYTALLGLALAGSVGDAPLAQPPVEVLCSRSFTVSAGATPTTIGVAARPGFQTVICGYDINAGAAPATFQLLYGTGALCSGSPVNLTPAFSLGINGVLVSRSSNASMTAPPNNAVCYNITGTGPINAVVYYSQF